VHEQESDGSAELIGLTDNLGLVELFKEFLDFITGEKTATPVVYQDCPSKNIPCLFTLIGQKGKIYLLDYVDDMLYFGTDNGELIPCEQALKGRFNLELLGQAHWYLSTRIHQLSNFDIELDQSRYCQSLFQKYLEMAGTEKEIAKHTIPFPSGFVPSIKDLSQDEQTAEKLDQEYNIDIASCIGSRIYLGMTRTDIIYAMNKLANSQTPLERNISMHYSMYYATSGTIPS
jgi:hypothetical protein